MEHHTMNSRGSLGNPPSLYDTSTSTAESWSTGSAGRRTPQHQNSSYPAYYLPKSSPSPSPSPSTARSLQASPMYGSTSRSNMNNLNMHVHATPPSPNKRYSNEWQPETPLDDEFHPGVTQSEPGVSADHDRFSAYVNRFALIEEQKQPTPPLSRRGPSQQQQPQPQPQLQRQSHVLERIQRYSQQYPDPEPVVSSGSEEEQRQISEDRIPHSRRSYEQQLSRKEAEKRRKSDGGVPQRSPKLSIAPSSSHVMMEQQAYQDAGDQNMNVNTSFRSVPSSSPAKVRHLRQQLWNDKEILQVSVPPTLQYAADGHEYDGRKSWGPEMAGSRGARSLSPGRRSTSSGDGESSAKQFNSKYYEAALAARLRGKLHQDNMQAEVPTEVVQQRSGNSSGGGRGDLNRSTSFSDRSASRPAPEESPSRLSMDNYLPSVPYAPKSEPRVAAHSGRPTTESAEVSHDASNEWMVQPRIVNNQDKTPTRANSSRNAPVDTTRSNSFRSSPVETRGRESSEQQRRGRGRGYSQERRGRVSSRERGTSREPIKREYSQEPPPRANTGIVLPPSPMIEERVRRFSQEPRGSPSVPSTPKKSARSRDHSQEPRVRKNSVSSIERLAREFSGEVHQVTESSVTMVQKPQERRGGGESEGQHRESPVEPHPRLASVEPHKREVAVEGNNKRDTSIDRSKHADVASYWQQKARTSPAPSPKPPIASRNSDFRRSPSWNAEKPARQVVPKSEEKAPLTSSVLEKKDISKLVAKLSAVSRANPAEALAQIDSILRQESRSSSGEPEEPSRIYEATKRESPTPAEDMDAESDDETSMSSITNPTYQSEKPYRDQVQVLQQNPFAADAAMVNTANPYSPKEPPTNPFSQPSTSSFRRPRPSALNNYVPVPPPAQPQQEVSTLHKKGTSGSRARERRQLLKKFPPPATIKVKENMREPSPIQPVVPGGVQAPSTPNQPQRKLDKFIANKEQLAAKIRVWDDMSNGLNKSQLGDSVIKAKDEGVEAAASQHRTIIPRLPAPPNVPSRRLHPWDGKIPARVEKVNTRDTSMDGEMGVETEMTKRNGGYSSSQYADPLTKVSHSPDAHKHDRISRLPPGSNQSYKETFDPAPSGFFAQASVGGWEVTPRMTPEQHKNAQRISADFDAAWVALPASTFFPEQEPRPSSAPKRTSSQNQWKDISLVDSPRKAPRRSGPVDLDMSFDTTSVSQQEAPVLTSLRNDDFLNHSGECGAIEVSLLDTSYDLDASAAHSLPTSSARGREAKSTPKRRGFLRAFMRKEKKKSAATATNQSVSQASVGAQSMPGPQSIPLPNRQEPVLRMMPLPPGFNPNETAPPQRGRTLGSNRKPPPRSRSHSLERVRSASMTEKFSRVMRLYDHD